MAHQRKTIKKKRILKSNELVEANRVIFRNLFAFEMEKIMILIFVVTC